MTGLTKKVNAFGFVKSVTETKEDIFDGNEEVYSQYIINKALSFNLDTLFEAAEMNRISSLPDKVHYEFYLNSLDKRRRYGRWVKKDTISDDVKIIQEAFGYSVSKSLVALEILTDKELLGIKDKLNRGGLNANKR